MIKYPSRNPNPRCDCGHAYHSHGMAWWGNGLAVGGMCVSVALALILPYYFGVGEDSHKTDPRDWWILPVSMPTSATVILFFKNPFKKICLLCKCPNFGIGR